MVSHDLISSGPDQSTDPHGNTDTKDNYDAQSSETPHTNNCSSYYFGDKNNKKITPHSSALTTPVKEYLCLKTDGKTIQVAQCSK